jgi:hypothetical protein
LRGFLCHLNFSVSQIIFFQNLFYRQNKKRKMIKNSGQIAFLIGLVCIVTCMVFSWELFSFVSSQHLDFFHSSSRHKTPAKIVRHEVTENSNMAKRALDEEVCLPFCLMFISSF